MLPLFQSGLEFLYEERDAQISDRVPFLADTARCGDHMEGEWYAWRLYLSVLTILL